MMLYLYRKKINHIPMYHHGTQTGNWWVNGYICSCLKHFSNMLKNIFLKNFFNSSAISIYSLSILWVKFQFLQCIIHIKIFSLLWSFKKKHKVLHFYLVSVLAVLQESESYVLMHPPLKEKQFEIWCQSSFT